MDHASSVPCPRDCVGAAAVHDNGTRTAAALKEDDDGCSAECVECETCGRGGGAPGRMLFSETSFVGHMRRQTLVS